VNDEQTLFLIDGYAQIFRAYFAIRTPMKSPTTGEPTNALFGFTGMLFKLLTVHAPEHVVVAMDAPGRTFRDELFSEYKGTRAAIPEDLRAQVPRIRQLLDLFGIAHCEQAGLEADDVIATIARSVRNDASGDHLRIRIITKDKDMEQLLDDRVSIYDVHTDVLNDTAALWQTKGIRPDQVIDYLTMTGDTVDNVPGVEGIGAKTAAQLLQQYGTLEGIYAHLDELSPRRREALLKAQPGIALSQALVTLKCDAELDFPWERSRRRPIDAPGLIALFQELGFGRYQDQVRKLVDAVA